jgi:hypothetical protein
MAIVVRGKHALPGRNRRLGIRVAMGGLASACAAAVAIALVLTSTAGPAAGTARVPHSRVLPHDTSIQITRAEREQLRHYLAVPSHRAEISSLLARSFKDAGLNTGTSSMAVPGRTSLDVAYGITGQHVWAIVSFADVYDGAVAAMTSGCVALMDRYDLGGLSWVCGWMAAVLSRWSAGHAWAANHGVWIAVYWWPFIYDQGGYW